MKVKQFLWPSDWRFREQEYLYSRLRTKVSENSAELYITTYSPIWYGSSTRDLTPVHLLYSHTTNKTFLDMSEPLKFI